MRPSDKSSPNLQFETHFYCPCGVVVGHVENESLQVIFLDFAFPLVEVEVSDLKVTHRNETFSLIGNRKVVALAEKG